MEDIMDFKEYFGIPTFEDYAASIQSLVKDRQKISLKLDQIDREIYDLQTGCSSANLKELAGLTCRSLECIEWYMECDPYKAKEEVERFRIILKQNTQHFTEQPIGPFYENASVKGKEWRNIVEKILFPHLFTFVLDNDEDKKVFDFLLDEMLSLKVIDDIYEPRMEIRSVVSSFSTEFEPPGPKYRAVTTTPFGKNCNLLYTLQFPEDTEDIWQAVVATHFNGDNTFVFETEHDAFIFMHAQAGVKGKKKAINCEKLHAYSLDGFRIFPFPQFKTQSFTVPKKPYFLKVDYSDDIKLLNRERNELLQTVEIYSVALSNLRSRQLELLEDSSCSSNESPNKSLNVGDCNNNTFVTSSKSYVEIDLPIIGTEGTRRNSLN